MRNESELPKDDRSDKRSRHDDRFARILVGLSMAPAPDAVLRGRWGQARTDVMASLAKAIDDPVVVVSGPPGSGKTTAVHALLVGRHTAYCDMTHAQPKDVFRLVYQSWFRGTGEWYPELMRYAGTSSNPTSWIVLDSVDGLSAHIMRRLTALTSSGIIRLVIVGREPRLELPQPPQVVFPVVGREPGLELPRPPQVAFPAWDAVDAHRAVWDRLVGTCLFAFPPEAQKWCVASGLGEFGDLVVVIQTCVDAVHATTRRDGRAVTFEDVPRSGYLALQEQQRQFVLLDSAAKLFLYAVLREHDVADRQTACDLTAMRRTMAAETGGDERFFGMADAMQMLAARRRSVADFQSTCIAAGLMCPQSHLFTPETAARFIPLAEARGIGLDMASGQHLAQTLAEHPALLGDSHGWHLAATPAHPRTPALKLDDSAPYVYTQLLRDLRQVQREVTRFVRLTSVIVRVGWARLIEQFRAVSAPHPDPRTGVLSDLYELYPMTHDSENRATLRATIERLRTQDSFRRALHLFRRDRTRLTPNNCELLCAQLVEAGLVSDGESRPLELIGRPEPPSVWTQSGIQPGPGCVSARRARYGPRRMFQLLISRDRLHRMFATCPSDPTRLDYCEHPVPPDLWCRARACKLVRRRNGVVCADSDTSDSDVGDDEDSEEDPAPVPAPLPRFKPGRDSKGMTEDDVLLISDVGNPYLHPDRELVRRTLLERVRAVYRPAYRPASLI